MAWNNHKISNKTHRIDGLPKNTNITFYVYKGMLWMEYLFENSPLKELAEVFTALEKLGGFRNDGITYDLGYYDSVDNKRMQLYHATGEKDLKFIELSKEEKEENKNK